ncbi:hypothetical protein [Sinorhizobium meliloti]
MNFWLTAISSAGVGIAVVRPVFAALLRAIGQRLSATQLGIKISSWFLSRLPVPNTWRGEWEITWHVRSGTFDKQNKLSTWVYRSFDRVTTRTLGTSSGEPLAQYVFIGEIDGANHLTGIWFDSADRKSGYHGVFQIKLDRALRTATGTWVGFASSGRIKSGKLEWRKVKDGE